MDNQTNERHDYRFDPFTEADNAVDVVDELKDCPANSPFYIELEEVPREDSPSTITAYDNTGAAALTEVSGVPAAGEFRVDYKYKTGWVQLHSGAANHEIKFNYKGTGSPNKAADVNAATEHIYQTGDDNFILITKDNTPNPNFSIGVGNGAGVIDTSKPYVTLSGGNFQSGGGANIIADSIDDGVVSKVKQSNAAVGDLVMLLAPAEQTKNGAGYTKVKEIRVARLGSYRMKWEMKNDLGGAYSSNGRIYVNGVAVGVIKNTAGTGYTTFGDDITPVAENDLIQLYIEAATGSICSIKNFSLNVVDMLQAYVALN